MKKVTAVLPTKLSSNDSLGQACFQGQSIITTNPEHSSSILKYTQTLIWFGWGGCMAYQPL